MKTLHQWCCVTPLLSGRNVTMWNRCACIMELLSADSPIFHLRLALICPTALCVSTGLSHMSLWYHSSSSPKETHFKHFLWSNFTWMISWRMCLDLFMRGKKKDRMSVKCCPHPRVVHAGLGLFSQFEKQLTSLGLVCIIKIENFNLVSVLPRNIWKGWVWYGKLKTMSRHLPAIWSSPDTSFNSYFRVLSLISVVTGGTWACLSQNDKNCIKSLLTLLQIESRISLSFNVSVGTLSLGGRAGDLIVGWSFDRSLLCMCNVW